MICTVHLAQNAELELCAKPRQAVDPAAHGEDGADTHRLHRPVTEETATDTTVCGRCCREGKAPVILETMCVWSSQSSGVKGWNICCRPSKGRPTLCTVSDLPRVEETWRAGEHLHPVHLRSRVPPGAVRIGEGQGHALRLRHQSSFLHARTQNTQRNQVSSITVL